jgi:3-dehydroquinate synthase
MELQVNRGDGGISTVAIGQVIGELERFLPQGRKIVVVTDPNVYGYYKVLIDRYPVTVIGLGEEQKTLETLASIYSRWIAEGVDRESFVLGFGGGIVTDIAGFAASTYMRGVRFGFVATTLLAQVDASVGGKNGVNCDGYKNMVGTFNQPEFVLCDLSLLKTLPEREFRGGLAEIIKAGLIRDRALFELFENHSFGDFTTDQSLLQERVFRAVQVKKAIVDADEKERGERKLLNLGHTLAHAIEKSTHRFHHGEAVAIGLVMIADLSRRMGLLSAEDHRRVRDVIEHMGLPTDSGIPLETLFNALQSDKKKEADTLSLILLRGVGQPEIRKMTFDELREVLF